MQIKVKNTGFLCINPHRLLKNVDRKISEYSISIVPEKKSLITILFHGLFRNKEEIKLNHVHPQQAITVDEFEEFVKYFKDSKYIFVSPNDIINGLDESKNHILITFDDGYFSNTLALPVLKKYDIPAVFFISSNHVVRNKCFWWDVLYRERIRQGYSQADIEAEIESFKFSKNKEIEYIIMQQFGQSVFDPISDIDRPFTPNELRLFANEKEVFIGNHTANHAILTNYSMQEAREEIVDSQLSIEKITGILPIVIAYPNGGYSEGVLKECMNIPGLKLGITTVHKKNWYPLNLDSIDAFTLSRFTLWGDYSIRSQCRFIRSELRLLDAMKRTINK